MLMNKKLKLQKKSKKEYTQERQPRFLPGTTEKHRVYDLFHSPTSPTFFQNEMSFFI